MKSRSASTTSRVPVQAGRRRIGVSFVLRSFAQSDSPLQPISQLPEMERVPKIPGFTVAGPFNVTGLGDTPSRRRIFICQPANASEELPCARRILRTLAGEAFRRPVTEEDLAAPLTFYANARQAQDFEAGIESGLTAILSSTKFLLREVPIVATRRRHRSARPIWSWPRDWRSSCGAPGPTSSCSIWPPPDACTMPQVLQAEVRRMLVDPRAATLVDNFAFQWLGVGARRTSCPTRRCYPDFDRNLRDGLTEELRLLPDQRAGAGPQRARPAARGHHLPERAAGAALRRAECAGRAVPAGEAQRRRTASACWARAC